MVKAASDAAQIGLGLSRYQFMAKAWNVARQLNIKTSVTEQHPLAWVMDKIAKAEATITLEASDNNVLSILRTSIAITPEKINAAISSASTSSTEQEPEIVQEFVGDMAEN